MRARSGLGVGERTAVGKYQGLNNRTLITNQDPEWRTSRFLKDSSWGSGGDRLIRALHVAVSLGHETKQLCVTHILSPGAGPTDDL